MPRILRILNRTNIGGPVLNASLLTKFLSPEYETLLISGPPLLKEREAIETLEKFNITPVYIKEMGRTFNPIGDLKAFWKIRRIIKDFNPDIVHTHAAKPGMLGRLAAKWEKVPAIVHTFHGHVFHSYYSSFISRLIIWMERYLAANSDKIIAISESQKRELSDVFRIAPEYKFTVVNLGLYLEPFENKIEEKRHKFRKEFYINEDDVVVTIIGRLVPIKNHGFFIDVMKSVLKKNNGNIKAFIVGGGEEYDTIHQKVLSSGFTIFDPQEPGKPYEFALTSWRSDIDFVTAGSDIIALTSLNEGTPVSLIEAQACGRPVISTACGGVNDVLLEGKTGYISPQADIPGFIEKLQSLIKSKPLRQEFGERGKIFVRNNFSHHNLINNIRNLYKDILR